MNRNSIYTAEKYEEFIKRMKTGETPYKISKDLGLYGSNVYDYKRCHPEFAKRFEEARAEGNRVRLEKGEHVKEEAMDILINAIEEIKDSDSKIKHIKNIESVLNSVAKREGKSDITINQQINQNHIADENELKSEIKELLKHKDS